MLKARRVLRAILAASVMALLAPAVHADILDLAFGVPRRNAFSTSEAPDPSALSPEMGSESGPAAPSSAQLLVSSGKLDTRYPVVLAHGILGFKSLGLGRVTLGSYFRGVIPHLRKKGLRVGITYVGKTNGVPERAERLKQGIDRMFPGEKVNIIAHSMGGLDARYMITHLGMASRVASLTTVATPHRGSYAADWIFSRVGQDLGLLKLLQKLGIPTDAAHHLTTDWCREFNRVTPDVPGVRYFSYGGHQRWYLVCPVFLPFSWYIRLRERRVAGQAEGMAARLLLRTRPWGRQILQSFDRDPSDQPVIASPAIAARYDGRSDGLVPLSSAPWGESFDTIPMDHIDQIGWLTLQNAPVLYEHIVRRLIAQGL